MASKSKREISRNVSFSKDKNSGEKVPSSTKRFSIVAISKSLLNISWKENFPVEAVVEAAVLFITDVRSHCRSDSHKE